MKQRQLMFTLFVSVFCMAGAFMPGNHAEKGKALITKGVGAAF
jgi:hypothetical protein